MADNASAAAVPDGTVQVKTHRLTCHFCDTAYLEAGDRATLMNLAKLCGWAWVRLHPICETCLYSQHADVARKVRDALAERLERGDADAGQNQT